MTTEHHYAATGRRKSAVARVRLYPGQGNIVVNEKPFDEVFVRPLHRLVILRPLQVTETEGKCPRCGQMRAPDTLTTLGLEPGLESHTFESLGIPPFDVVTVRAGEQTVSYLFDADGEKVLGPLARD